MKKIFATLCVLALIAGASSCKKDETEQTPGSSSNSSTQTENIDYPEYHEGQYIPIMKISTVTEGSTLTEEWTWIGDKLDYITTHGDSEGEIRFTYDGDYITSVTNGPQQEMRYSYADGKITTIAVNDGNTTMVEATLLRNNSGKISGATLDVDDEYLRDMISAMTGFGSKDGADSKFDITSNTITLAYEWNNQNITTQRLNVSVDIKLTQEEYNSLKEVLPIPEQYQSIADALVATQGGLPLRLKMNDTTTYTYDNRINPHYCFWGTMISAEVLSLNNVLTETTTGTVNVAALLMGMEIPLLSNPTPDYTEYEYEYNSKYYPTKVISGETETSYTYK